MSKTISTTQLVATNLRRARDLHGWTQEQAADRIGYQLGVRWTKAAISAAEHSGEPGARVREFRANDLLAFSRVFGVPIAWFFLPPEGAEELPSVSCGGPEVVEPHELWNAAMPHADPDSVEGPRLRALAQRPELRDDLDNRIYARAAALAPSPPNVSELVADVHRFANALGAADDQLKALYVEAAKAETREETT